ncbi:MAG: hypothetical protein LBF15_02570 [Candidatus Peribacteria bacterium]|jgi:hypothetical protein|nr:hypothetical protein [Candidatus Peribacteria bacterium]
MRYCPNAIYEARKILNIVDTIRTVSETEAYQNRKVSGIVEEIKNRTSVETNDL